MVKVEQKLSIDELDLLTLHHPQSIPEVNETVRKAAADGSAIFPLGGRTMLHLGLPPTREGIGVDLRNLNQVIDYPARDMTITVQAGITMAQLQGTSVAMIEKHYSHLCDHASQLRAQLAFRNV